MSDAYAADTADKPKRKKKKSAAMTPAEFQSLVYERALEAVNYSQTEVSDIRKTSTDYYKGRLPDVDKDDAEEDRSQAVLTEVRDTVLGMMPDVMRVCVGVESLVRYDPVAVDDPVQFKKNDEQARIATDYVNTVVIKQDNPDWFLTFHDTFQDAFVRKTGFIRWYWEKSKKPIYTRYSGLDEETVMALLSANDEKIEVVEKTSYPDQSTVMGGVLKYDILVRRICDYGKARIAGVPCEQVVVSPKARSVDRTSLLGFIDDQKTVSDFMALGLIDSESELEHCDEAPDDEMGEAGARQPKGNTKDNNTGEEDTDKTLRKVQYGEFYLTADFDGDGIAELRRVITAGTAFKVLENEPWDDVDFAAFCPYPVAHTFFGDSVADLTMDIQRIKSRMLRDVLDSLAQAVKPITTVVEGQVNLDDVLSPDTSPVIRQRAPNMVGTFIVPFVGKEAMPVIDYMTNTREARTGMSDASRGLDPKAMQSTERDAVMATLTKADARIELVARIFAETGMKRLFKGLLKLIHKHQTVPRMEALRGKPTKISPQDWNVEMQVVPNLPLGRGGQQQQLSFLTGVLAKQQELLTALGPKNPLVTIDQFYYTLKTMLDIGGWSNSGSFFTDPGSLQPEQRQALEQAMMQAMQQAAGGGQSSQGAAPPDPAIEQAKLASKEKIEQAKIQFQQWEVMKEFELESAKIRANFELEAMKALSARTTALDMKQMDAMIKAASDRLAASTKIAVERLKPRGGSDTGAKDGGAE